MTNKYDGIINMPHHVSKVHPRMSMKDRAAQFSPFAALTGYEDAIDEAVLDDVSGKIDTEYLHDAEDRPEDME